MTNWTFGPVPSQRRTLLEWLGFCKHMWNERAVQPIVNEDGNKIGHNIHLNCIKCGTFKIIKV